MKPARRIETVLLKLRVNVLLAQHLDLAVQSGLFGHNRQQCGERLIAEGLRRLLKEGVITADSLNLNPVYDEIQNQSKAR